MSILRFSMIRIAAVAGVADPASLFVRLTKRFVKLLQERTGDAYVLRVDLRLRPDPGSTAVAVSPSRGLRLLRNARPELGARGLYQGASGGGRHRARPRVSPGADALHLAQIFRLCGDRRHPRDEAADPCRARPRRGHCSGPRRQARTRRHSRDRVFRPDPATDLRRQAGEPARLAHARNARRTRRRRQGDERAR